MAKAYAVYPYDFDHLKQTLCEASGASLTVVGSKFHCGYFSEYFSSTALNASTIIIENDYVDRDYLDDYSAFYVRCLTRYPSHCKRLHFFNTSFSEHQFRRLLSGQPTRLSRGILQESYLGFIVVKPLPKTIIGRTCLKLYPDDHGRRHFPCKREYQANLFGIPLHVETIAFQEQDTVVAACATSALWSVFHSTGQLFHHPILTPIEITRAATAKIPDYGRSIPNKGLDRLQMASAIREVGLEPHYVPILDEEVFYSTIYGYLKGRVPIVAGVRLYDSAVQCERGAHAIGIMGYSLGQAQPRAFGRYGFLTEASRIDKIYAHDDQIGPFARMTMDGIRVTAQLQGFPPLTNQFTLSTTWTGFDGQIGFVRAIPDIALVPLYHKIRIPYGMIHDGVGFLDYIIRMTGSPSGYPSNPFVWDIYLTTVECLKEEILTSTVFSGDQRHDALVKNMPRYVWRATAKQHGQPVVDLLFDATELEQASLLVHAIEYDSTLAQFLRLIAQHPLVRAQIIPYAAQQTASQSADFVINLLDWYIKNP